MSCIDSYSTCQQQCGQSCYFSYSSMCYSCKGDQSIIKVPTVLVWIFCFVAFILLANVIILSCMNCYLRKRLTQQQRVPNIQLTIPPQQIIQQLPIQQIEPPVYPSMPPSYNFPLRQ
ncbi:Hypothetical_protein [Hexamita inflata]|uniref:Hypothetical_protein n=1 Tax=Hexamita inflata TaxID=28002 RepID=A0AA86QEU8_9EUKA|nr:Hypothetical protein HINF_LOCUS39384 [Hexamita inflata]